jgi:hypothetical protein
MIKKIILIFLIFYYLSFIRKILINRNKKNARVLMFTTFSVKRYFVFFVSLCPYYEGGLKEKRSYIGN